MELGIAWPSKLELTPTGAAATSFTLTDAKNINSDRISVSSLKTTINIRKEDGDSNLLANPRIRVKNREKAKIHIGDRLPVITTTSTANVGVSESVSYLDVGLKLDVEPNIYLDDDVSIKVALEVSSIVSTIKSANGTLAYQVGTRNAATVLRLKDGETQVLAGLINDEDRKSASKVPGLGDIPILGRLFGSHLGEANKNEIVLLITPHVVRNIARPSASVSEFMSGTEAAVGAPTIGLKLAESITHPVAPAMSAPVPAKPAPSAPTPPSTPPADTMQPAQPDAGKPASQSSLGVTWQGPAQVKVGQPFTLMLNLASDQAVSSLPILIGYDPTALQAVSVTEGDFLKQNNAQTQFSQRVDQAAGRIFVGMGRASGEGAKGAGSILSVTFKPLQPNAQAKIQVLALSAGGDAAKLPPVILPLIHNLAVMP